LLTQFRLLSPGKHVSGDGFYSFYGQEDYGGDQFQYSMDRNADDSKREEEDPDYGVEDEGGKGQRPTEEEEGAPEEEG
jgi:hypothetical protein